MENELEFDIYDFNRSSRAVKCGNQLFPYDTRAAYSWAEGAFQRWMQTGFSPEQQRDERAPQLMKQLQKRNPKNTSNQ